MAIEFTAIPIKVLMNEDLFIQITPTESLLNDPKLRGLCSNYDGNANSKYNVTVIFFIP